MGFKEFRHWWEQVFVIEHGAWLLENAITFAVGLAIGVAVMWR